MDTMTNGITPVMNLGEGGGFGDGWMGMIWLFAILALFGGGGFGFGGNNNGVNALNADMQRGFDAQNLQAQTRDILGAVNAGTAQTVAAVNNSFHDTLAVQQNLYNETARDIAALAVGQANLQAAQAECCCSTKQAIMQNNYDAAMRDANTTANLTAQIQSVKDMISQNTIQGLRDQVDALRDQVNMSGVLKFPNTWSYGAGPFPPIYGCGCGNI